MSSRKSRANLLDVARHAGVSPATVSRVVNNTAPVREAVRLRVLSSLRTLGYEPPSTRPNVSSHSLAIALVLPDILNPFFTEVVRGVQDEALNNGHMLLLLDTMEDAQNEKQGLDALIARPVGGIIFCASRLPEDELIVIRTHHKIPMVVMNRKIRHPGIPGIMVDYQTATYRAARHLCNLNHVRIAFLAGPARSEASQERRRGVESALAEVGLHLVPEWCPESFPSIEGGFQVMSKLLAMPERERPTAVIAYNDIMALGALHSIRANNLRVPQDISLVGFDDIAMAAHSSPPLTTVSQPKYRLGRLAMKTLDLLIQENMSLGEGYTLLESSLVVRESTGPAAIQTGSETTR